MATIMKQFFELSNETEDSDDQLPAEFYNQPDFEESDDQSEEESDEESDEELEASEESGDDSYNRTDRICIRKVIKQEQETVANIDPTLYDILFVAYCINNRCTIGMLICDPLKAKKVPRR